MRLFYVIWLLPIHSWKIIQLREFDVDNKILRRGIHLVLLADLW